MISTTLSQNIIFLQLFKNVKPHIQSSLQLDLCSRLHGLELMSPAQICVSGSRVMSTGVSERSCRVMGENQAQRLCFISSWSVGCSLVGGGKESAGRWTYVLESRKAWNTIGTGVQKPAPTSSAASCQLQDVANSLLSGLNSMVDSGARQKR